MIKGDLELADNNPNGSNSHVAMAIGKNDIVHARSSEGTKDTKDNSGNEIRTQPWYLYSHGWTHRLRFTGKEIDFSGLTNTTGSKPTTKPSTSTTAKPTTTTTPSKTPKWVGKVTATKLKVRKWAGTENAQLKSYPTLAKGNLVDVCDAIKAKDGTSWYYIRIAGKYFGFVSTKYICKV